MRDGGFLIIMSSLPVRLRCQASFYARLRGSSHMVQSDLLRWVECFTRFGAVFGSTSWPDGASPCGPVGLNLDLFPPCPELLGDSVPKETLPGQFHLTSHSGCAQTDGRMSRLSHPAILLSRGGADACAMKTAQSPESTDACVNGDDVKQPHRLGFRRIKNVRKVKVCAWKTRSRTVAVIYRSDLGKCDSSVCLEGTGTLSSLPPPPVHH